MKFGKFVFSENKYQFDGKWYTPNWNADPFKMTIAECKQILETAYNAAPEKSPKGILIVTKAKWDEIAKSYATWDGLAKFHYYDTTVPAGNIPQWMASAASYDGALVHEYQDGKVVYRGKPELLYKFFKDTDPPSGVPEPNPTPTPTPTPTPGPLAGNHFRGTITSKRYFIGIPIGKTVHELDVWLDQDVDQ